MTGMGLVSPVGNDVPTSWANLLAGKSGGALVTAFEATEEFPCRIGCEVKGFEPLDYMDKRDAKRFDRVSQFAIAASAQALASAGLGDAPAGIDPDRFGVIIGSGIGGIATFEEQHRKLIESGPNRVSPFFIPMFIPDISTGLVSMRWGLRGPNYATVSACASSAHAIGNAAMHISSGQADLMLAGGAEATITREGKSLTVALKNGWLLSSVRQGQAYRVVTARGEIAALGTEFFVRIRPDKDYVCICEGRLRLSGAFPTTEISAEAHSDAWMDGSTKPDYAGWSMEGHDDDEWKEVRRISPR